MQKLLKTDVVKFENREISVYGETGKSERWYTRQEIGLALGYTFPKEAIQKIHERNKIALDKVSREVNLTSHDLGGREVKREIILYNQKGLFLICKYSDQPKAEEFLSCIYDRMQETVKALEPPEPRALLNNQTPRERKAYRKIIDSAVFWLEQIKNLSRIDKNGADTDFVKGINDLLYRVQSRVNELKRQTLSEIPASVQLIDKRRLKQIGPIAVDENEYSKIDRERDMYGVYTSPWADAFFISEKEAQKFIRDKGFHLNVTKERQPKIHHVDLIVMKRK